MKAASVFEVPNWQSPLRRFWAPDMGQIERRLDMCEEGVFGNCGNCRHDTVPGSCGSPKYLSMSADERHQFWKGVELPCPLFGRKDEI